MQDCFVNQIVNNLVMHLCQYVSTGGHNSYCFIAFFFPVSSNLVCAIEKKGRNLVSILIQLLALFIT